jgi:hypothetical protein
MDIVNIVDRLDALVNTSRRMPGTHSRLVDAEKVMEVVQQLRLAIPQDMRAAQEVIERKDHILSQAQVDAKRLKAQAEDEFRTRVDQNEIVAVARRNSEQIVEAAERKAARLIEQSESEARRNRAEADAYMIQAMRNLEAELTTVLSTVRKGLETLGATVRA